MIRQTMIQMIHTESKAIPPLPVSHVYNPHPKSLQFGITADSYRTSSDPIALAR
jgi:hypothetical protein